MSETYTWNAAEDEHRHLQVAIFTPVFRCQERKLRWYCELSYSRYQIVVTRVTQPLFETRQYPRKVDSITLVDNRDLLAQPKDCGNRRQELWTSAGSTAGCTSSTDQLDWEDVRGLREWFPELHAKIEGGYSQDEFRPLIDWLTESSPLFSPLITEPGEL